MILMPSLNNAIIAGNNIDEVWSINEKDNLILLMKETHQLLGFNKDIPMTATPTSITSGDIVIDITGDCENITTLSRQDV